MISKIEIIKQPRVKQYERNGSIHIFGKEFNLAATSDSFRVILHEDYPIISEKDMKAFITYSVKRKAVVISGCEAKVHAYRLMYIDEEGYDRHLADILQTIRGNRHVYPELFQFVPALVSIPPNMAITALDHGLDLDMYTMPVRKLLDKSSLTEKLLIMSLGQSSD